MGVGSRKKGLKKSSVMFAGAAVASAIGVFLVLASIPASTSTTTFTLPSGLYYYWFQTATLLDGEVSGSFEVTSGDNVTLMIFDQEEYKIYEEIGEASEIYVAAGSHGNFSASLSGVGKLFVVFEHELLNGTDTNVSISYRVGGLAVTFFVIGAALLASGVVLGIIAWRRGKAEDMKPYLKVPEKPQEDQKT